MPRKANIGDQIEEYVRSVGAKGATILEMMQATGCVRQTPSNLVKKKHPERFVIIGKTDTGATIYVHADNAPKDLNVNLPGANALRQPGVMRAGDAFELVEVVGLIGGSIVAVVRSVDGVMYEVVLTQKATD